MKVYALYETFDWEIIPNLHSVYESRIDAENTVTELVKINDEEDKEAKYHIEELDVISDSGKIRKQ